MDHKSVTPAEISHAREIRNYRYFTNVRDLVWSFKVISSSDKILMPDTNAQYVTNLLLKKPARNLTIVSPKIYFFKMARIKLFSHDVDFLKFKSTSVRWIKYRSSFVRC